MKGHGKYAAFCLMLLILACLGGCGNSKIEMGQWEDNVFTNDWYDIKVTIPDGYQVLGTEEVEELLGAGQKVIVNDGLVTEEEIKKTEGNTIYDFYVFDANGTSSLALGYEKLPSSYSEEKYLEIVKSNLESLDTISYEIGEFEKATIGKHEYMKLSASLYGGMVSQEYYVHRQGGYMGFLIVTYNEETKAEIQEIVKMIE